MLQFQRDVQVLVMICAFFSFYSKKMEYPRVISPDLCLLYSRGATTSQHLCIVRKQLSHLQYEVENPSNFRVVFGHIMVLSFPLSSRAPCLSFLAVCGMVVCLVVDT